MNAKIQSKPSFVSARSHRNPRRLSRRWGGCVWFCALGVSLAMSIRAEQPGQLHVRPLGATPESVTGAVGTNVVTPLVAATLPPLPLGVSELKFNDFFVQPVGARGLTFTDKLRHLDGKRVRILGYMVRQEQPVPGMFLFSAIPVRLNEEHYGLAEDLPAATVFVSMPTDRDKLVRPTPGMMLLTGTLSVGNREEPDGRISTVRLALDPSETGGKR